MLPNIKKVAILYTVAIFFIVFDRFLKTFFFLNQDYFIEINRYVSLVYAENRYIALSIPFPPLAIKYISLLIFLIIVYYFVRFFRQKKHLPAALLFVLILGSFSNIFDRFKYGFVVDYIKINAFSILNLADTMIFVSIALLSYLLYTIDKNVK